MRLVSLWIAALQLAMGGAVGAAEEEGRVYHFLEPEPRAYEIEPKPRHRLQGGGEDAWVEARPLDRAPQPLAPQIGARVVLQLQPDRELRDVIQGTPLRADREVGDQLFILQASDPWEAAEVSERLSERDGVMAAYPVMRRPKVLHGRYAALPDDLHFEDQFYLENRDSDGQRTGADLNVRAAWPISRGEGVTIAIADNGLEIDHPDLEANATQGPHFDFINDGGETDDPPVNGAHATGVAGLAAARGGNGLGISGVAPRAQLASWVIFGQGDVFGAGFVNEEQLMDMLQTRLDRVPIQNHSWGNAGVVLEGPGLLARSALRTAFEEGREGKGVIMVRAGGNSRAPTGLHPGGGNVNDDGFANDHRAIAVAAVDQDGRAASYSNAGAPLLVAAPGGEQEGRSLLSTDLSGNAGINAGSRVGDSGDFAGGSGGWRGTSFATPQISGVVALMLETNSDLTYRDVQQILIHSARHFDLEDPSLKTNGAGFQVSDNVGFGIPDAGHAVRLARDWELRPEPESVRTRSTQTREIPDDGLRLRVTGPEVPASLRQIRANPSMGPHPDEPTDRLPLVDVGKATEAIEQDLSGKAALIQRGETFFRDKIRLAAEAGASFAVVYNHQGEDELLIMGGTDFVPIPAVFISQNDGEALRELIEEQEGVLAAIRLDAVRYTFDVSDPLVCEHVLVEIDSDHRRRGDLRITLVSPGGARSVLQTRNEDVSPGPRGWTYSSTQHFYESSVGEWEVAVSDQTRGSTGAITEVDLTILGVPIEDSDADGLDDGWEQEHFGSLTLGPTDDPDEDGYSNAREQVLESDATTPNRPFEVTLSPWKGDVGRLSWPGYKGQKYEVLSGESSASRLNVITNVSGGFPVTEWFVPLDEDRHQFFKVRTRSE